MPEDAPEDAPGDGPRMVALDHRRRDDAWMIDRARALAEDLPRRRSVRHFSPDPVPRELIEHALRIAGSAPSGAHQQPWTWVVVTDPGLKARIRAAAEEEERTNYAGRMGDDWLEALAPLGTDAVKHHLTDAPYVVVLFRHAYGLADDGTHRKHYYTTESCGIAAGMFLAAIHQMGLASLTHTPSPMGFLGELLDRPENERAYLVLPVGHPADDAVVPDLQRRRLDEIAVWR